MKQLLLSIFLFLIISIDVAGQEFDANSIQQLSKEIPELNDTITMSVSNWSVQEFLRAIANISKLNFDIGANIDDVLTVNFSKVKVYDILSYVSNQFNLEINVVGNIFIISKKSYSKSVQNEISYDSINNLLCVDVHQKPLPEFVKLLTKVTGKNIIPESGMEEILITSFIQKMPYQTALENIAFANDLTINKKSDSLSVITPKRQTLSKDYYSSSNNDLETEPQQYTLDVSSHQTNNIDISAERAPLDLIISESCRKLGKSFYINEKLEGIKSLEIHNKPFDIFILELLNSTPYTCLFRNGTYLIGSRTKGEMKETKVVYFQNRTISKVKDIFPKHLSSDIEYTEFVEQNSVIISGPSDKVSEAEYFLKSIDQQVPVILIEVIIVDFKSTYDVSTGINIGFTEEPVTTSGSFFPEANVRLSSSSMNNILNSFRSAEAKKIGVKSNIYMTLKAMEEQGILKVRSTPKLSTLNGHEASLVIGQTEYFEEESSNIVGNVGTTVSTYKTYKSVDAEMSIQITPVVSGNEKVTLEVIVKQSDFTERITKSAPPGVERREFKSTINVLNEETVILGGLEESDKSETASGTPLLSRVPIIKWLFSSRSKKSSTEKLNVFIKPTILE